MAAPVPIGLKAALLDAVRTKSGMVGTGMLGFLILLAILVPVFAPYDVIKAWGGTDAWQDNPKLAAPEWSEVFSGGKHLPRTIFLTPAGTPGGFLKFRTTENVSDGKGEFKLVPWRQASSLPVAGGILPPVGTGGRMPP